ncbi:hypothetical protein [Sandarakinorhabdus sp.]|nr:hypothetical protein [Sandarakinorhabdus sp.]
MKITTTDQNRRESGAYHPLHGNRILRRSPILTRSELRRLILDQLG